MRNKKRIKRVLRQWIQQLEKIVNTCRVSIDRFLSKLIHQSTIERAALRNYTLINPINSLVDNSLRRQNFCIFERRIPRMLHKSFPATLSNSTDAYTSPILYPLSLSLSLLYPYWPPVARDNSFMHLWRTEEDHLYARR